MPSLADIHLKPDMLARHGLPDMAYPVPMDCLQAVLAGDGELPFAIMLHGLQQRSSHGQADWQALEPAMERLSQLLSPDNQRDIISAAGDDWWLEVGPVDLGSRIVTVQRGMFVIAALSAREDGRIRVAVLRPLDAKSARSLIGLSHAPHPVHGVCMRENNWEYALDCSAGTGNFYASDRGEPYLSYWEQGIGVSSDGTEVAEWNSQKNLIARRAAAVVTELGVYYTLSDPDGE